MLILLPPGLLLTSFVFDIIYLALTTIGFWVAAFWIAAGVIGGWERRCSA